MNIFTLVMIGDFVAELLSLKAMYFKLFKIIDIRYYLFLSLRFGVVIIC